MANPGIRDVGDLRMPAVRYPGGGAVGEWARGGSTTFEVGGVAIALAFSSVSTNFYHSRTGREAIPFGLESSWMNFYKPVC